MENNAEHIEYFDLIVRVLSGEANLNEKNRLESWKMENSSNAGMFEEFKTVWDQYGLLKDANEIDLNKEWKRFEKYIGSKEYKQNKTAPNVKGRSLVIYLPRIAAIFVIGIILSSVAWFTYKSSQNKKITAINEIKEVKLGDGTKVTLNVQSTIKYPKSFKGNERRISLQGEAYFEVEHDAARPFIIETGTALVQVLGTSFSVSAYKESGKVEVIVNTGKVSITDVNHPDKKIIVTTGNKCDFFPNTGQFDEAINEDVNYISWKTKKLLFVDEKLEKVVSLLNKVYHKNIVIGNESLRNCPITVTFDNQSLEAVLKVISNTIDVKIEQTENEITITGKGC